jgi:hypothetical protein
MLGLSATAAAAGLTGCVTTQQKNAWLLLRNARTLASEDSVRVRAENPSVRVRRVEVVRAARSAAIVVSIANVGTRPLSDLPISVGVLGAHGARTYLNAHTGISYWDSHVSAVGPGATISWVLPYTGKGLTGRPFALVGSPTQPPSTTVATLPRITVAQGTAQKAGSVQVHLVNDSSLPQYGLQVYAVALRHGAAIGAGRVGVNELSGSGTATVGVTLAGSYAGAQLQLYAPPTIFK